MSKSTDLQAQIEELEVELEGIPARREEATDALHDLNAKRRPLFIDYHVHGNEDAGEELAQVDADIATAREKLVALDAYEADTNSAIDRARREIDAIEHAVGNGIAEELVTAMDDEIVVAEALLLEFTSRLQRLQETSNKLNATIKEHGLQRDANNYRRAVNYLSPRVVLCLGRVGKLNLNSSITSGASEWYRDHAGE